MAQTQLTNFFPTVKKSNKFFVSEKGKPNKLCFPSFFDNIKNEDTHKKATLLDYFPKKPENPMEQSPQLTMKLERKTVSTPKTPNRDSNLLIKWLKREQINEQGWAGLPKEIILRIMQFLSIKENARLACVCRYYKKCFNSIWFSYDFMGKFNFNTFSTEKQINKVFEKASRLCHIKKMKSILTGKKVDAFIKKTKLSTTLSKNMQTKGSLFEEFSVEPRMKGVSLFLTDREVIDICESSKFSLMFISLVSCQLLTEKSFDSLAKCENLQNLAICKNKYLYYNHDFLII